MSSSEIRPFAETGEHSYHRRAFSHDYYAPFIYHIIIKKVARCRAFGRITGDARIAPGSPGCAKIQESDLGKIVAKTIIHLPYEYSILKPLQFCVMPDHIHLLLQVLFRSEKHLDFYIDSLKSKIASKYSQAEGRSITQDDIFEPGYCDKPLYDGRSLDGLYTYIRENPHRFAMRIQYPQFFQRTRKLEISGKEYEAYGNLFLFRNPDKEAVKISRKFTPEENQRKRELWLSSAAKGSVLVSPFISPAEKAIRTEAEVLGSPIILITHEAFSDRYKPAARDFDLCTQGRLLIISLGLPASTPLSRDLCQQMNALAQSLAQP